MCDLMFLCAGLGTRLRPLTDELPKPLVWVGDRPLLAHLLEGARSLGMVPRVVNVHAHRERFREALGAYGEGLHVSHEAQLLGTAGGVSAARPWLQSEVVVLWNGDILTRPPLERLVAVTRAAGLALVVAPRARGEGTAGLDAEGRVVRLRGERFGEEVSGGDYVGILAMDQARLRALPAQGCLIGDVCLPWLRAGHVLPSVPQEDEWVDIGRLEQYQRVNREWLKQHMSLVDGSGSYVGPGARLGPGVTCRASLVGAGATIEGEGLLDGCVIWPGARSRAPLSQVIVTTLGKLVPMVEAPYPG